MRAVVQVDIAAEGTSPGGVMQTVAPVERHPVVDEGPVVFTGQIAAGFLAIDAENTVGGVHILSDLTGDKIGGYDALAVFIEPQVLLGQIDLNVCTAIGHVSDAAGLIGCGAGAGGTLKNR